MRSRRWTQKSGGARSALHAVSHEMGDVQIVALFSEREMDIDPMRKEQLLVVSESTKLDDLILIRSRRLESIWVC